ncbi:MAG: substrate-binding domain-containing protein, partial [Lachnospiraceae bacterium]|nr:substrate-binding domain-containing protein [Lachnospiraceae bacterium]
MEDRKNQQYNPYTGDDSSNPPQTNCAPYYISTILYVFIAPIAALIVLMCAATTIFPIILELPISSSIFESILEFIFRYLPPVLVALAMFYYAHFYIGKYKADKPNSLFGIYLPVFIFLGWQLFITVIFTLFLYDVFYHEDIIYAILSLNFYGSMFYPDWTSVITYSWLYNLCILGGFVAGERLAFRKTKVMRKPFRIKYVSFVLICSVAMLLICEVSSFYKRINIIKRDPEQEGYGFAYENGYSSTDLEPYYVENDKNILAKLDMPSTFMVSEPTEMPVLDGAEAAYPIYSAFAKACYKDIGKIQNYAKQNQHQKYEDPDAVMPIKFSNTIIAFKDLVNGDTDIFFGAKPSPEQQKLALEAGKGLVMTPIGKEAFIFFVNSENPVDGLTSDQIRNIYSGEINNWKEIGGANERILAFQRPENSGSQTMMEYFMGKTPLKEPLQIEYIGSMSGLVTETASYQNRSSAIGYSFRYFAYIMIKDLKDSDHI